MTIANPISHPTAVPFSTRGPVSAAILDALVSRPADGGLRADLQDTSAPLDLTRQAVDICDDIIRDDDLQLSLFLLYGVHYGGIVPGDEDREWDPQLIAARRQIEQRMEHQLRATVTPPTVTGRTRDDIARALFELAAADSPTLARYAAKKATREQMLELLVLRSVYTLKEADPHSWAIPRLRGRAKAALVEIQSDEYGGGDADWLHADIYARAMRAAGLRADYGTYIDHVPAITLASMNLMSLFGLNRRLRGAAIGHLAAVEMTSAIPCRLYAEGLRRTGFGDEVALYFDEHVEADAVHEQIAARDLAGSLAEDEPDTVDNILFGAAACLTVDGWVGAHIRNAWDGGRSALRKSLAEAAGTERA